MTSGKDVIVGKRVGVSVEGQGKGDVLTQGICEVTVKTKNESQFLLEGDTKFRFEVG